MFASFIIYLNICLNQKLERQEEIVKTIPDNNHCSFFLMNQLNVLLTTV